MSQTVLIADDDATIVKLFSLDAENRETNITIRSSATGEETIDILTRNKPDVLVLDIRMPKGDGFTVLEYLQKHNINLPVVILTNYQNEEYVKKSKSFSQVKEYMIKHEMRIDRIIDTVGSYLATA